MELFALIAVVAIDVLALEYGFGRREGHALAQMDREIADGSWRPL